MPSFFSFVVPTAYQFYETIAFLRGFINMMKYIFLRKFAPVLSIIILFFTGCQDENGSGDDTINPDRSVVYNYFKQITLGSEFGNSSQNIRKWDSEMRVFLKGDDIPQMETELEQIITELNELIEPINIVKVDNELDANYIVFLGSGDQYATEIEPNAGPYVDENLGFFWVYWDASYQINRGSMYVDVFEVVDQDAQQHLLREEFTQSLGMMNDSAENPESIFYQNWTTTTEYAAIDREVIELLYNTPVETGMDATTVDQVLANLD